ncbi:MAG TPA: sigma factor, partial [Agriterribacter sp.]|nr:sigma factor [Agriterribacter sp.]
MKQAVDITRWVRAACAGDEAAWNYLYQSCHAHLYSVALKICGNTSLAKDSVQDTFVMAYIKLPQLREPATFFGWIKKICIHICYRSLQKNRFNNTVDNI